MTLTLTLINETWLAFQEHTNYVHTSDTLVQHQPHLLCSFFSRCVVLSGVELLTTVSSCNQVNNQVISPVDIRSYQVISQASSSSSPCCESNLSHKGSDICALMPYASMGLICHIKACLYALMSIRLRPVYMPWCRQPQESVFVTSWQPMCVCEVALESGSLAVVETVKACERVSVSMPEST